MAVVLKISCQGQLHRILFGGMPDYADVDSAVKGLLPAYQPYATKYLDDEGDLCSLVEPTFADFLTMAKAAPSGQSVFHIEVFPLADAVSTDATHLAPPTAQPPRSGMRRQERPLKLKGVWEDDVRDLDELLKQFEEPVASNSSSKKKKKKSKKPQPSQECWVQDPDVEVLGEKDEYSGFGESHAPLAKSQIANIQEDDGGGGANDGDEELSTQAKLIKAKGDATAEASVEETAYETEVGEYETDGDASWEMHMGDSLDAEQCESEAEMITFRRSASCPCFSAWLASIEGEERETGSLIEKAWPFVDPAKVLVNVGRTPANSGLQGQVHATPLLESLSGSDADKISSGLNSELTDPGLSDQAKEHIPSSSAPCIYDYPQVVWMPVLINWAAAEYASTLPGEGPPIDWARGMQVAQ